MLKQTALCLLLVVTGLVVSGNSCLAAPGDPSRERIDESPARQEPESADPSRERIDESPTRQEQESADPSRERIDESPARQDQESADPPRERIDESPARQEQESADPPGDCRDQFGPLGGIRGLGITVAPSPMEKVVVPAPDSPRERRPLEFR